MKKMTLMIAMCLMGYGSAYCQTDSTSKMSRPRSGSWKSTDPGRDNGTMNRKDLNNPTPNTNTNTNTAAPNSDNSPRTPNNNNNGTFDNGGGRNNSNTNFNNGGNNMNNK